MKNDIYVLRIPSPADPTRDPIRGPFSMGPQFENLRVDTPPEIKIDRVEAASEKDLADIRRDPTVVVGAPVMPLALIKPRSQDPSFATESAGSTWGVSAVGADRSPVDGAGITVAVLDTGIDASHPAFAGVNLVTRDFTGSGSAADTNGHGTHCAGTIFGRNVNGLRIGVAPGVTRALIGKVLGGPAGGGSDALANAMHWAVENGASVISMSLGIDFPGYVDYLVGQGLPIPAATSVALEAYRANVFLFEKLVAFIESRSLFGQATMVVAATGNESERGLPEPYVINISPPAAATGILGVGALRQDPGGLKVADFSNNGATLAAPGVNVTSAWPGGGLNTISGTSMATPHVAGVTALWAHRIAQQNGNVQAHILKARLIASGTFNGLAQGISETDVGAGLVRAPESLIG